MNRKSRTELFLIDISVPVIILCLATIIIWLTNADIRVASLFYSPDAGWFLKDHPPWTFLYHYGMVPAFSLAAIALLIFLGSFFISRIRQYRKMAILLILLLILGPGLIINTVLKDHWGRPRPNEIAIFNGENSYLPIWEVGRNQQNRSFPSGHAAIGYFLIAPFFPFRKVYKLWARFFLTLGIAYGSLMGLGRMAQGGHFLSDVIWSCGLIYITGIILYYCMRMDSNPWWDHQQKSGA